MMTSDGQPLGEVETSAFVVFTLADHTFALDASAVERVVAAPPITHVPKAPSWIAGVAKMKGAWMPVLDLRTLIDLPAKQEEPRPAHGVIASIHDRTGILLADRVHDVLRAKGLELQSPPPTFRAFPCEYVQALIDDKKSETAIILLDLDKLLTPDQVEQWRTFDYKEADQKAHEGHP